MKKLEPYVIILRRTTGTVRCVIIPYQYKNIEIASDAAINLTQYSKVFKTCRTWRVYGVLQLQQPVAKAVCCLCRLQVLSDNSR